VCEVTGRRIYDFMLIFFLNAIPLELRQSLKHVRVQTDGEREALWWFHMQKRYGFFKIVVKRFNAPLLESFEVVGISQHALMRLQPWERMDFEV
jgi:hypothetical protein